jgi:nitric oxide reductase NorE protein
MDTDTGGHFIGHAYRDQDQCGARGLGVFRESIRINNLERRGTFVLTGTSSRRLPGELGVWILIGGDLILFSVYFLTFAFYRADALVVFSQSQSSLNRDYGALNTVLLLTSSLLVAIGLNAVRGQSRRFAPVYFGAAAVFGLMFSAVKIIEWRDKWRVGIKFTSNDFFMFYFMFTGIHFAHVVLGLAVLVFMMALAARSKLSPRGILLI